MPTSRRAFLAGLAATAAGAAACSGGSTAAGPSAAPRSSTGSATTTSAPASTASGTPTRAGTAGETPAASTDHGDLVHGPRDRPLVALTFHGAGEAALTRSVLAETKAAGARITVLAVGTWLAADPELARAITGAGHELGNHTWSHQAMRHLSSGQARTEVARAAELLDRLTGAIGPWFRPSGTPTSDATIRAAALALGYPRCLSYDVDPLDYTDPGAASITSATLARARAGSIVSLHLGHPGTVTALPQILRGLSDRGLQAVTVSELMAGAA
jgi:peptidoglycan/xylan/chitin deacetylase (PgdA/CDA1 family)